MDYKDLSNRVATAKRAENNSAFLLFEVLIISLVIGANSPSWMWGAGVLVSLVLAMQVSVLNFSLVLMLSACWGLCGFYLGTAFGSSIVMLALAVLGFLLGMRIHMSIAEQ